MPRKKPGRRQPLRISFDKLSKAFLAMHEERRNWRIAPDGKGHVAVRNNEASFDHWYFDTPEAALNYIKLRLFAFGIEQLGLKVEAIPANK